MVLIYIQIKLITLYVNWCCTGDNIVQGYKNGVFSVKPQIVPLYNIKPAVRHA